MQLQAMLYGVHTLVFLYVRAWTLYSMQPCVNMKMVTDKCVNSKTKDQNTTNLHSCYVVIDVTNRQTFENDAVWKADLDSKVVLPREREREREKLNELARNCQNIKCCIKTRHIRNDGNKNTGEKSSYDHFTYEVKRLF